MRLVEHGRGIAFLDPVENVTVQIGFDTQVDPLDVADPDLPVEVDRSVEVRANRLRLESVPAVVVRDGEGDPICAETGRDTRLSEGPYVIEISCPVKLYVAVRAPVSVYATDGSLELSFGRATRVVIAARLLRSPPPPTVETTREVSDLFAALSTFGGAIASSGPDRSFPTMREHPPRLAVGESLDIPPGVERPDTGLQLELPPDPLSGAIATPLAYYLGTELAPGDRPGLTAEGTRLLDLGTRDTLSDRCAALLDRVFFFDALAGHAEVYDIHPVERDRLEERVDVDWQRLHSHDPIERVRAALAVPDRAFRDLIPDWRPRMSFVPSDRGIASLPYLADELARLHGPDVPMTRGGSTDRSLLADGGVVTDSSLRGESTPAGRVTRPPVGLDRAIPEAFENGLRRERGTDAVTVTIVCNDEKMAEELDYARSVYDRPDNPFVSVRRFEQLTREELLELLAQPIDYLHYIGHIRPTGFVCADGYLDLGAIDSVGVELAFLNACDSREQALELIDAGTAAAIATRATVLNEPAVKVGKQVADLVIRGFPIGRSLELVRRHGLIGHQYTVHGDPTLNIVPAESGVPYYCRIERAEDDRYLLTIRSVLTSVIGAGTAVSFLVHDEDRYYLNPAEEEVAVDRETLEEFLSREHVPVLVDGHLRWSDESIDRLVSGDEEH